MQIRADFLSHKLPNYLQLVKLIKGNSYLSNEAPRGKAARYLRNSSKPPILLRPAYAEASAGKQCFAGFSSPLLLCEVASLRSTGIPASPAAGYSAKENNEFQQHDSDFTFVRIGDENTMPSTGADHGPVGQSTGVHLWPIGFVSAPVDGLMRTLSARRYNPSTGVDGLYLVHLLVLTARERPDKTKCTKFLY